MKTVGLITSLAATTLFAQASVAATITVDGNTYTTELNAGSGPDTAAMALEYNPSAVYLFGSSWDPNVTLPTGLDMLNSLAAASGGTLTTTSSFGGLFINTINYKSNQVVYDENTSW